MTRYSAQLIIGLTLLLSACGGDPGENAVDPPTMQDQTEQPAPQPANNGKGVGPITELALPAEIDHELAKQGEKLFEVKCSACHKMESRYIGPAMQGVITARQPEWIMNFILVPEQMLSKDEVAKAMLKEYGAPMPNVGVRKDEARAMLEYFRLFP